MQANAYRAYFRYLKGGRYRDEMVAWAVAILSAGGEGLATTLLAGSDYESDHRIADLFLGAAQEQGISLPDRSRELEWCEHFICSEIVGGHLAPQAGLADLYQLWVDDMHSSKFQRWCALADGVEHLTGDYTTLETFDGMTLATVDEMIVREAKAVISNKRE